MQTIETAPTAAPVTPDEAAKVPFFARKQGRPGLVVRSGVQGGKESEKKAI
ncbi:MAG: hypothetical protein R3B09_24225 [Nannocystaceae bacterium]